MRPMLTFDKCKIGLLVFWDDRFGWYGWITAVHSTDKTIDVQYDNGESDSHINPEMFSYKG